jgi:hypothetical protein
MSIVSSKYKILSVLLLSLIFMPLAAPAQPLKQRPGAPELVVLSPKPGQTFDDTPIFVRLQVKNFKLVPPIAYFGKAGAQNVGHIHIILDDHPLIATAETQIMIGKMAGEEYLSEGKHTLWIELSVDNHDGLTPPVRKKVTFYFMHPKHRRGASG